MSVEVVGVIPAEFRSILPVPFCDHLLRFFKLGVEVGSGGFLPESAFVLRGWELDGLVVLGRILVVDVDVTEVGV